jgi:2',3'-cyclic-nucleotide 2'-phosphodiesterase/3'-nucleotidase
MKNIIIVIATLSIVFSSCQKGTIKIHLIETTDVHGRFFNYDFVKDTLRKGSLAQVATFIDSLRKIEKNVILLDNGDIIQGDPAVYYSNYIDTTNKNLLTRIYETLSYDVATIGNHDIEAGPSVYYKIQKELSIPWLGANIIDSKTGEPVFKPYHIIEKDGIKIAILGITTPGIPNWLPKKLYAGLQFKGMVETTKRWMPTIKKEKPDIIVGLFHAGLNAEYGGFENDDPMNPNATLNVAREVEGFDIIFAGHDHRKKILSVLSTSGDSVIIVNGGSHGRFVGQVELSINKKTKKIENISANIRDLQSIETSQPFIKTFEPYLETVKKYFNQSIGTLKTKLCPQQTLFGPSAFMQFIHDIQIYHTKADVSLSAPLQIHQCIDTGQIRRSDIFALYKYENYLATMNMTVGELDLYLEYAIKGWFNTMTKSTDPLLQYKENMRLANPYYNFSTAEGIDYTIDVTKPVGEKVTITAVKNQTDFSINDTLTVAINSYRMVGGGGHLPQGLNIQHSDLTKRNILLSKTPIKSVIMDYFKTKQNIKTYNTQNWKIIPEDWVLKAKEKEIVNF